MSSHGDNKPEVIDLTTLSDSLGADGDSTTSGSLCNSDFEISEVNIHFNEEIRTKLKNVVNTIPAMWLQEVLVKIISTEPAVGIALSKELIMIYYKTHTIVSR